MGRAQRASLPGIATNRLSLDYFSRSFLTLACILIFVRPGFDPGSYFIGRTFNDILGPIPRADL